eukprot:SAG11_NODE_1753_length_4310_cov_14.228707_3_plen_58_part_00
MSKSSRSGTYPPKGDNRYSPGSRLWNDTLYMIADEEPADDHWIEILLTGGLNEGRPP